jgi:hypothetical protein
VKKIALALLAFAALCAQASAQTSYQAAGGGTVPGAVQMCVNAAGAAVPCGDVNANGGYGTATPITGNATGSTGAVVGTLAAVSTKTTYICGFDVSAIGGTAAVGPITVAGLVGSSAKYQLASTATGVTLSRQFTPCIPASAINTAITITTTADGTATAVAVNSWGFQQ